MKLKDSNIVVESSGQVKDIDFSIDKEDQGLLFEMLRNKIYKKPIDAICREIASNSRDANVEVGRGDVPIEVEIKEGTFLIDNSSLYIEFRDCGPGISEERMENVFCKYAKSTKRDTNDQIGGFGLGAKTPFAYTDIFIINTVSDGRRYSWVAYIDESKRGKLNLQHVVDTEDPNGTSIIIPIVSSEDRRRFEDAVIRYTYLWSVRPVLINFGKDYPKIEREDITLSSGNVISIIRDVDEYSTPFRAAHLVLIDEVPYEIDLNTFDQYHSVFSRNNGMYLCFNFGNGVLDLPISRETVQFTDYTKGVILGILEETYLFFKERVSTLLNGADSYIMACLMYLYMINEIPHDIRSRLDDDMKKWNSGLTSLDRFKMTWFAANTKPDLFDDTVNYNGIKLRKNLNLKYFNVDLVHMNSNKIKYGEMNKGNILYYYFTPTYMMDTRTKSVGRSAAILDNSAEFILLKEKNLELPISLSAKEQEAHTVTFNDGLEKEHELLKSLGIPINLYSAVVPKRLVGVTGKHDTVCINVRKISSNLHNMYHSYSGANDRGKHVIAYDKVKKLFMRDGEDVYDKVIYKVVNSLGDFYIASDDVAVVKLYASTVNAGIFVVPERFAKHFAGNDACIKFEDVPALLSSKKIQSLVDFSYVRDSGINTRMDECAMWKLKLSFKNKYTEDVQRRYSKAERRYRKDGINEICWHSIFLQRGYSITPELVKLKEDMKTVWDKYPMIKFVNIKYLDDKDKHLVKEYIRIVNKYIK